MVFTDKQNRAIKCIEMVATVTGMKRYGYSFKDRGEMYIMKIRYHKGSGIHHVYIVMPNGDMVPKENY